MKSGLGALPAARRRGAAAPAAGPVARTAERHRADRRPRAGPVGRLAPSRPAQGRRPGRRRAGRRLHLLPLAPALCRPARDNPLRAVLERQFAAAADDRRRARRRGAAAGGAAAAQGELRGPRRARHPRRAAARAGPQLGGVVARPRPAAAAAEVADLGCGEGYLTIEAARWASRVIAVDRSDGVLARARPGRAAPGRERHLEARRARAAADRRRQRRRRAALAGAASRAATRRRAVAEAARIPCPAAACWSSICARTTKTGCARKLGDRSLGFSDDELKRMLTGGRPARRHVSGSARARPAIRSPCWSRPGRNPARERRHEGTTITKDAVGDR